MPPYGKLIDPATSFFGGMAEGFGPHFEHGFQRYETQQDQGAERQRQAAAAALARRWQEQQAALGFRRNVALEGVKSSNQLRNQTTVGQQTALTKLGAAGAEAAAQFDPARGVPIAQMVEIARRNREEIAAGRQHDINKATAGPVAGARAHGDQARLTEHTNRIAEARSQAEEQAVQQALTAPNADEATVRAQVRAQLDRDPRFQINGRPVQGHPPKPSASRGGGAGGIDKQAAMATMRANMLAVAKEMETTGVSSPEATVLRTTLNRLYAQVAADRGVTHQDIKEVAQKLAQYRGVDPSKLDAAGIDRFTAEAYDYLGIRPAAPAALPEEPPAE